MTDITVNATLHYTALVSMGLFILTVLGLIIGLSVIKKNKNDFEKVVGEISKSIKF